MNKRKTLVECNTYIVWGEAPVELPLSQNAALAGGTGVANLQKGQTLQLLSPNTYTALKYEDNKLVLPQLVLPPGPGS